MCLSPGRSSGWDPYHHGKDISGSGAYRGAGCNDSGLFLWKGVV